ncbi:phosphate acyltransferase, partial [Azospirillum sp. TSO35-2]|uniref:phosphate acyltransferase n=1 Tax=Azospirillum sp. TSO35-2 TaxID=716796 RepID=UPI000D6581CF
LQVVGKRIEDVKIVSTGGGAAGIACLDLLVGMGVKRSNITLVDLDGVVYRGRNVGMNPHKERYATDSAVRSLADAMAGADLFLGLSGPGVLTGAMVKTMAPKPLILALANPDPEITPEEARAARPDAIIATGRSDYPNQVNNVLCFPFIFRGALDVGATTINEAMKIACVRAIADMARAEASDVVAAAYTGEQLRFGPDYILPKPFDPRLIVEVASAVAKAAMDSGVATRPLADLRAYRERLGQYVFRSGLVMKPVFHKAAQAPKRVVYAEGEDDRVLRAAQVAVDDGVARPILLGRVEAVERKIRGLGLRLTPGGNVTVIEPARDPRSHEYADVYRRIMERRGVSPAFADTVVRTDATVFAALMVRRGAADAMICGTSGRYAEHHGHVRDVLGRRGDAPVSAAMNLLILDKGTFFLCDTHVNADPTAAEIAEIAVLAAEKVRHFGIEPKVALLSHSNFGSADSPSAVKMRKALDLLRSRAPDLEADGEMHADAALSEAIRDRVLPNGRLRGQANLLVMPTLDAANIAFEMLKVLGDGLSVGPILLGVGAPAHIVTPAITSRGVVNVTALAVVDAQMDSAPFPVRQAAE